MAGDKPGPDTHLTDELFSQIKKAVLEGGTLKEIAERCNIPVTTLYTWHSDNHLNIADKIEVWRLQSKLEKADRNIDKILDLPVEDKEYTKVVASMSQFVKETLDKKTYSKRAEVTGADGKDIELKPILVKFMDHDDGAKDN